MTYPIKTMRCNKLILQVLLICLSLPGLAQSTARNWIDTKAQLADRNGNVLSIANSLPKGGGRYTDTKGITYSYVVFWYRVTNESDVPAELSINFSSEPLSIYPNPSSYARVVLPDATMTIDKIDQFDYGLTD